MEDICCIYTLLIYKLVKLTIWCFFFTIISATQTLRIKKRIHIIDKELRNTNKMDTICSTNIHNFQLILLSGQHRQHSCMTYLGIIWPSLPWETEREKYRASIRTHTKISRRDSLNPIILNYSNLFTKNMLILWTT
jgi:type II secretory pathway component PulJ